MIISTSLPTASKTSPFPRRCVPSGPRLRSAETPKTLPRQPRAGHEVCERSASSDVHKLPEGATTPPRHKARPPKRPSCFVLPAASRVRVRGLDSLRRKERLPLSRRSILVRSLPRGLERARLSRDAPPPTSAECDEVLGAGGHASTHARRQCHDADQQLPYVRKLPGMPPFHTPPALPTMPRRCSTASA